MPPLALEASASLSRCRYLSNSFSSSRTACERDRQRLALIREPGQHYMFMAPAQRRLQPNRRQQTVGIGPTAPEQHLEALPGLSKLGFELQRP